MPFSLTLLTVFFPLIALLTLSSLSFIAARLSAHVAPRLAPLTMRKTPAARRRRARAR